MTLRLSAIGVRLAIDDFGTGYSFLSYLRELPIDVLKVDKSFVDGIAVSGLGLALAEGIVQLARTLWLEVIAKGIEKRDPAGADLHGLPVRAGLRTGPANAGPARRRHSPGSSPTWFPAFRTRCLRPAGRCLVAERPELLADPSVIGSPRGKPSGKLIGRVPGPCVAGTREACGRERGPAERMIAG